MKAINQRLTYPGEHYHWAFISAEEGYDLAATAFFEAQNAFGATRKMRAGVVGKKEGDKWSITILFVEPYVSY
jgi:hypothetical protein